MELGETFHAMNSKYSKGNVSYWDPMKLVFAVNEQFTGGRKITQSIQWIILKRIARYN